MSSLTTTAASSCSQLPPSSVLLRRGAWTQAEDQLLRRCIEKHGALRWSRVPQMAELKRCRKSCRLRWLNYLDPRLRRGMFEEEEVDLIIRLHKLLGNRWSLIAGRLSGRTANDVKNYWNSRLRKKLIAGSQTYGERRRLEEPMRPQTPSFSKKRKSSPKRQKDDMSGTGASADQDEAWVDHLITADGKYIKKNIEVQREVNFSFDDMNLYS